MAFDEQERIDRGEGDYLTADEIDVDAILAEVLQPAPMTRHGHHVKRVDADLLARAKNSVMYTHTRSEWDVLEYLIAQAQIGLGTPTYGLDMLRDNIQRSNNLLKEHGLRLLDRLQVSSKAGVLTDLERFAFVGVMSTQVFHHNFREHDPHKLLFCTISGRSELWWRKHHKNMLQHIADRV
jgi:hypothetical protein